MKRKAFFFNRIIAVMLLASVFTFAFVWSYSSASTDPGNSSAVEQPPSAETENETSVFELKSLAAPESAPPVLKSERRGFPLLNLQDGKTLETKFVGSESAARSFASARALTMAKEDLNLDGVADLIVAYSSADGGHLALYPGNPDALSARTAEAFEAIKEGRFPAPFLPEARLIELSIAPDFIATGDFNRDGYKDMVAAERGTAELFLLLGNSNGNYKAQSIEMPGRVTALMAENIDPADGQSDIAVALSDTGGARLYVFDYAQDIFAQEPRIYPLPAEATSLAIGQLDDSAPMDILAAAGGRAVIIHGSFDRNKSAEANAGQVEVLNVGTDAAAVRVGHFIWDRENRPEIALLTSSETVRILQRGKLDTRQYAEEEFEAHLRAQDERDQIELMRRSADSSNHTAQTNQKQRRQKAQSWTEADSFQLASGTNLESQSAASVFTSTRMTTMGVDDLIIANAASRKVKILLQNNEILKASGESYEISAKGTRALVEFESEENPAAVLPMRLGVMTRPGLVTISRSDAKIKYSIAAPETTYTVTKTADTFDGVCDADCSLREAIRAANLTPGVADMITVPAGTYTLTIGPADDSPFDTSAQGSGDLDIRDDLTILGAEQATTIIEAGTSAANGIDRVLHVRQASAAIVDLSISGVTIRHGKCDTGGSDNPGSARCSTGGAGLFITGQDGAVHTISDSTITTNWNVAGNSGASQFFLNGAGVYVGRGGMTLTNVTVSNNENGAAGSLHGGSGGGLLFGFSSATSPNNVVMNNCTVTGNIARRLGSDTLGGLGGGLNHAYNDVDINGGTYSNNTADSDGGAFYLLTKTDLFGNFSVTGNTANRDGGGIFSSNSVFSITNGSINNNTANTGKGGGIRHNGSSNSTISGVTISNNTGSGVSITGTGSLDASNNTITGNSGDGITKIGTGVGSHFDSNTIHSNGELGIDLSDDSVTLNDSNDVDSGPNNLQNFPVINYVRRGNGVANVTLNAPNGKYRIQYYANTACDASGHGEGEQFLASQVVNITLDNTLTFDSPSLAFGAMEQITATATHSADGDSDFNDDGSTSEFSACRPVNTPPSIAAQATNRQQGSAVSNSQIATVTDPDQALNTLAVTVNGAASATVNGVTVSDIAVDANGNVTANVAANCLAINASFTLRVTDGATDFDEATLDVNVTQNTPPTLGNYTDANVTPGDSTTVSPDAAPADNGSFSIATASAPGFSGTLSVDSMTSVVTVTNANPVGIYTVTVTFTDNCGLSTEKTFTLTVNTTPTISGETISRQQGNSPANSQIATVNDDDQSEDSVTVTVNGGASATINGVTVSGIAVAANGSVTADVVASCTATNASFTLTATDSVGATNTAALTVNVTPNSPPTVGTYPNTSVVTGNSTTVTPSAAPADNGSIASLTASAPGFAGTFSGDTTTGTITVSNASSAGNYTVTVTATDNCGATTTTTFQLLVNTPPTITGANTSRQQGSPSVNSQIATVNDADQNEDTLTVTVNGGAAATVDGVTVSNIAVSPAGIVTADVVAACNASNASFTLTVTDSLGASASATLNVTVVLNMSPGVGNYPDAGVSPGGSTTVTPSAAPADNGSIVSATATAPGFTGTLSVSPATGVVTVTNAGPSGTYTVTVTFTDNCGAVTTRTFTLKVNSPPTVVVVPGGSCDNGGANGTVNLLVGDDSTPPGSLTISVSSSNTTIMPNSNIVLGGSGANRTLTVTPVPVNQSTENSVLTITVSDGQGLTSTTIVTVVVGGNGTQTITGTSGNDVVFGFNGGDTLSGGGGNDLICGGNGNDTLIGGEGDDTLDGDNGNDILQGEGGDDILSGGAGADFFSGGSGTDTATDFNPGEGDTTDGTLGFLREFIEMVEKWAEEE